MTLSGSIAEAANKATGPPMMIPNVAVKNITRALEPNCLIPLKSILRQSKIKEAGSMYLDATKYRLELSPEIIFKGQFNKPGIK
jgi:hypothetical protein